MPPSYTIRESTRARRPSLRISAREGLVVVLPKGYGHAVIPRLLTRHATWIVRNLRRAERARAALPPDGPVLPEEIRLPALARTWQVTYERTASKTVRVLEDGDTLRVVGATKSVRACKDAIGRWLHRTATAHLLPLLADEAAAHRMRYRRASIRAQKTRWGSCTRAGAISLNGHLLFFDPPLVRYVILHELAHLVHLHHRAPFWTLVASWDAEAEAHRKTMAAGWNAVPRWARR